MSELTICNYCILQRIKRNAKVKRKKVEVKSAKPYKSLGGFNIFIDGKKAGWMWKITDHCVC